MVLTSARGIFIVALLVHTIVGQSVWPNLAVDELEDIVFLTSGT